MAKRSAIDLQALLNQIKVLEQSNQDLVAANWNAQSEQGRLRSAITGLENSIWLLEQRMSQTHRVRPLASDNVGRKKKLVARKTVAGSRKKLSTKTAPVTRSSNEKSPKAPLSDENSLFAPIKKTASLRSASSSETTTTKKRKCSHDDTCTTTVTTFQESTSHRIAYHGDEPLSDVLNVRPVDPAGMRTWEGYRPSVSTTDGILRAGKDVARASSLS